MNHSKELPKVVDKSQADIDAAIAAIQSTDLPTHIKEFAISCIRLAIWLPKALLEHKIKLAQLRQLIFGLGRKNKKRNRDEDKALAKTGKNGNEVAVSEEETINILWLRIRLFKS